MDCILWLTCASGGCLFDNGLYIVTYMCQWRLFIWQWTVYCDLHVPVKAVYLIVDYIVTYMCQWRLFIWQWTVYCDLHVPVKAVYLAMDYLLWLTCASEGCLFDSGLYCDLHVPVKAVYLTMDCILWLTCASEGCLFDNGLFIVTYMCQWRLFIWQWTVYCDLHVPVKVVYLTRAGIYTNFWTMVATWSPNFHFQGAQQII
jgi:hypothetical protein